MYKSWLWGALVCLLLSITACTLSLPEGKSGSVAMIPFTDENYGIRGNAPLEGWTDQAMLLQQSFPGTRDELVATITEQTDLVRLPVSTGAYAGAHLTWELYTFTTQLEDAGPGIYRVDMALAKAERDAGYYLVALVAQPAAYESDPAFFRTVFEHALYALVPLE